MRIRTLTALLLLAATLLMAAMPWEDSARLETVIQEARKATAETYPDADSVILSDIVHLEYLPSGTCTRFDDTSVKVLTEKGREDFTTLTFSFNQSYASIKVHLLQTIDEDGTVTNLPAQQLIRVVTDNSDISSNIFDPNQKILLVRVPNLKPNATLRYVTEQNERKVPMPDTFSTRFLLEYTTPIVSSSITIIAPEERPLLHRRLLNQAGNTVTYQEETLKDGRRRHVWRAANVPRLVPEPRMPSPSSCAQRLLVSTLTTWNDLSRWYWELTNPHLMPTPEIIGMVNELVRGKTDDYEKIRAIFTFVSQKVRYMGETTEQEAPGFEPHDVGQTFAKRHGVCRDKAALLVAMLRQAGFEAYPVLIHVGDLIDPEVPMLRFNHAITAVRLNGSYLLMDSTNEQTKALFPEYLMNRSYLVATPEGASLMRSPVQAPSENSLLISTTGSIDEAGTLHARSVIRFQGLHDTFNRDTFTQSYRSHILPILQLTLSQAISGARLLSATVTPENPLETSVPLSLELQYEVPSFMKPGQETATLHPPRLPGFSLLTPYIFREAALLKRRFPYMTRYTMEEIEKLSIAVHPRWGSLLIAPAPVSVSNELLDISRELSFSGNVLSAESRTVLKTVLFTPEEYGTLKAALAAMSVFAQTPLVFEPARPRVPEEPPADVSIIDMKTDLTLHARNSWTQTSYVKKQILSQAGKGDSEIIIRFIPRYQTAQFDFVRVYNNGNPIELDLKETKLMDQEWVGKAPRYSPGKLLIANLPGIEIGSIVEYQYTIETRDFIDFSHTEFFTQNAPVRLSTLCIRRPTTLPLKTTHAGQNGLLGASLPNPVQSSTIYDGDTVIQTWTAENQPAREVASDRPNAPELHQPFVHLSTASSGDFLAALGNAIARNSVADDAIRNAAASLKGLPDRERLLRIRDMAARFIRVDGPNAMTIPFTQLSKASDVLHDGYGNNADVAILLNTLLREAGFSPEILLVQPKLNAASSDKALSPISEPSRFSVIILRVKVNGETIYLNDGDIYAEPGTCAYEGHQAMTLNGHALTLSVPEKFRTRTDVRLRNELHDDGSATLHILRTFFGNAHNSQVKLLKEMTPSEIQQLHEAEISAISNEATAASPLDVRVDSYPCTVSFSVNIPRAARMENGCFCINPMLDIPNILRNGPDRRTTPVERRTDMTRTLEVTHILPTGFTSLLSFPSAASFSIPNSDSKISIQTQVSGNRITLKQLIVLKPSLWKAGDYPELLRLNAKIIDACRTPIIAREKK